MQWKTVEAYSMQWVDQVWLLVIDTSGTPGGHLLHCTLSISQPIQGIFWCTKNKFLYTICSCICGPPIYLILTSLYFWYITYYLLHLMLAICNLLYCQAQFQFSASASQVELRLAILSLSVHPPTHPPTHPGKYIWATSRLPGKLNFVLKFYSTEQGQLAN